MHAAQFARRLSVSLRRWPRLSLRVVHSAEVPDPTVVYPTQPRFKALFVDAAGTLLSPAQPVTEIYQRFALKFGVKLTESQILSGYREAFAHPPLPKSCTASSLRYVGDGKDFWRYVIQKATGCDSEALVEALYSYYEQPEAWSIPSDAKPSFLRLKRHGVKVIVVSNFDTRLRPLLEALGFHDVFEAVIVSAEVEMEKPNPCIFEKALEAAECEPLEVIHVGDDRRNDIWGARKAGIDAWLWGTDVATFQDIADRILTPTLTI